MSFWLEDDEPYVPSSQMRRGAGLSQLSASLNSVSNYGPLSQETNDDDVGDSGAWKCENCGGSDYYMDSATGQPICQDCFTQSQQPAFSQDHAESNLEYEDVVGLAGKTRSGGLLQQRQKSGTYLATRPKKLPIEDLDTAVPFPNLNECLEGMTHVLRNGARIIARLLRLNEKTVQYNVKNLWLAYLRAWSDGAEHYGTLYPGVRFSFRDAFVTAPLQRMMIFRHLSYQAAKKIKSSPLTSRSARRNILDDQSSRNQVENNDQDDSEHETARSNERSRTISTFAGNNLSANVQQGKRAGLLDGLDEVLKAHGFGQRQGYKEAALQLVPSMTMATALLWLAVARAGVPSGLISEYVANTSIPILNAYRQMLPPELQKQLALVASFFRLDAPPSASSLEKDATLLMVACRMHAKGSLVLRKFRQDEVQFWSPGGNIVQVLTAHLIAQIGLTETILDQCFAIMGLSTFQGVSSLELAVPTNLTRSEHVLAVIALACTLDPGWKSWLFGAPSCQQQSKEEHAESRKRALPWTEEEMNQLGNGVQSRAYLDFIEAFLLDPSLSQYPCLQSSTSKREYQSKAFQDFADFWVKPCQIHSAPGILEGRPIRLTGRGRRDLDKVDRAASEWKIGQGKQADTLERLLIEFLAYSTRADAIVVLERFEDLKSAYLGCNNNSS